MERPETLPDLELRRMREIHDYLSNAISLDPWVEESLWMLYMAATEPYRNGSVPLDQPLPRTPLPPL